MACQYLYWRDSGYFLVTWHILYLEKNISANLTSRKSFNCWRFRKPMLISSPRTFLCYTVVSRLLHFFLVIFPRPFNTSLSYKWTYPVLNLQHTAFILHIPLHKSFSKPSVKSVNRIPESSRTYQQPHQSTAGEGERRGVIMYSGWRGDAVWSAAAAAAVRHTVARQPVQQSVVMCRW